MNRQELITQHPSLADSLRIRINDYMPHMPTPKQRAFLCLPFREALFGGAAGGGKSDALLMGALQYVDVPSFKAIIFRRTLADLRLPSALLHRSQEWLQGTDARFDNNAWRFPSGAILQFGYLDSYNDKLRYQSAEFQYIAFDELTQFREEDYLYLFSRLRRTICPQHDESPDPECSQCQNLRYLAKVPLRVRAATNPGGPGHVWVRDRFEIKEHPTLRHGERALFCGQNPTRPHIPAFIQDNPYIKESEYVESLSELDIVTREQLLAGDWSITADGRFRKHWIRRYSEVGELFTFDDASLSHHHSYDRRQLHRFLIIDPASSSQEGPGDQARGAHKNSRTVFSVWYLAPTADLILKEAVMCREESPQIVAILKSLFEHYAPDFIGMELSPVSSHLFGFLKRAGFPMKAFTTGGRDKVTRAITSINRMHSGQFWFPRLNSTNAHWLDDFETELFTWTGHPEEPDDVIDVVAYAGMYVSQRANDSRIIQKSTAELPSVY